MQVDCIDCMDDKNLFLTTKQNNSTLLGNAGKVSCSHAGEQSSRFSLFSLKLLISSVVMNYIGVLQMCSFCLSSLVK